MTNKLGKIHWYMAFLLLENELLVVYQVSILNPMPTFYIKLLGFQVETTCLMSTRNNLDLFSCCTHEDRLDATMRHLVNAILIYNLLR